MRCLLLAATVCAGLLVWQYIDGGNLPGCGPTSACAGLATSRFGTLLGIPASMLGLAYCLSLWVARVPTLFSAGVAAGGRIATVAGTLVLLGGMASLFYLGVMATSGRWCLYCLAFHLVNLAFVITAIVGWRRQRDSDNNQLSSAAGLKFGFQFLGTFAAVVLLTTSADRWVKQNAALAERAKSQQAVDQVLSDLGASPTHDNDSAARGFTGRYPRGRSASAARLVVFQDYQCGDCRNLEAALKQRVEDDSDFRVSIRQLPLCDDCNPEIHYPWFHPNACRAAAIAEAAAQLAGEKGFWIANDWLFRQKGEFEDDQLAELATRLDIPLNQLIETSQSEAIQQVVQADIEEGLSLGVSSTPFVFLNGVAVEGAASDPANVTAALDRIADEVQRLAESGTPAKKHDGSLDPRPVGAADRVIAKWQKSDPVKQLPQPESCQHVLGDSAATERVILFLEPTYGDADGMWQMLHELVRLRERASSPIRVELYLYPISRELNPRFADRDRDYFPRSTVTTRILKAVDLIGGDESFDEALVWIASGGQSVEPKSLTQAITDAIGNGQWTLPDLEQAMNS
ncbi:thioredoxin domain-containing protein, partial [bacterium]|nr:thioredoxin domain-containing protein [bacterium]